MRLPFCLVLLSTGLLVQCHPRQRAAPAPLGRAPAQLKVLTFNVNYAGVDMSRSARAILASDADVVALQETTPAWERYLRKRLRQRYRVMRFEHSGGAGGMAFLSRHPLQTVKLLKPSGRGWFPAWLARVRTRQGSVYVLNVHLRPPIGSSGRLSSVPAAYFYTQAIRQGEIEQHLRKVPPGRPLIVLGDFNESSGPALRWVRGHGLRSALAKFDRRTPTWRWRTSVYTFRKRLDHIFVSKHFRLVGAQVLGYAASDHYPVEAVLALGNRTGGEPSR